MSLFASQLLSTLSCFFIFGIVLLVNMGSKGLKFEFSNTSAAACHLRYGLVVRIAGSHPAGPGSIPGNGSKLFFAIQFTYQPF